MITRKIIRDNLADVLTDSISLNLPGRIKGKVRDIYDLGDRLLLITTDRQSAFDRILAFVPFKGQVLNQISAFWFEKTSDIVKNHVISVPDPNVTIAEKCDVFSIEFVLRGYLTGSTNTSAWTLYKNGQRNICGNHLPDGMKKNQKFEEPILTPTTKSDIHDESISAEEIVSRGLIDKKNWEKLSDISFRLFDRGTEIAAEHGMILVDTKYEFGRDREGNIVLIDEIHTPDSSRYWLADGFEDRFSKGEEPDNIDKEFLRKWYRERCNPYEDKELPEAPDDLIVELSSRYITLYEKITGNSFEPSTDEPVLKRIKRNLELARIFHQEI